jgi:hypothetical protein
VEPLKDSTDGEISMKRSLIALVTLPIVFSCSVDDQVQPPGNEMAGTGNNNTAGTQAVAGSPATGGGGSGSGGSGNPMAGTSSGGMAGTTAGGMPNTSGSGGSAGSGTAGSAGAGGSAGTGGGGGGGVTIADVVGKFDGFLFVAPCSDGGTGYDCTNGAAVPAPQNSPACSSGSSKTTTMDFAIGGEMGKVYNVTMKVYGIVETKIYQNGMRRAGQTMDASNTGGDFWYVGGTAPNSTYNTYELHVTPKVDGEANDYFLNSRPDSENHSSWALNYSATIAVPGGGKINFRVFDSNCRQIMNCGPGAGSGTCQAPRNLDLNNTDPKPPASFMQPFTGGAPNGATGQWVYIDVTKVEAR